MTGTTDIGTSTFNRTCWYDSGRNLNYEYSTDKDLSDRNAYIRECRLFQFSELDACVIDGCLKYWRVLLFASGGRVQKGFLRTSLANLRFFRFSESRGLHSTRKINSGRWY